MKEILSFKSLFKTHWPRILSVFFFILLSISYARIFAIGTPYAPGITLDPACIPGEVNCIVQITSGGGLIGSTSTISPTTTETWLGTSVAGMGTASTTNTVFIGVDTGKNATGADYSNFIGNLSGNGAISASYSNFIGYGAGQNANGATNSNFIGNGAGVSATNAYHSNFIGQSAGGGGATYSSYSNFIGDSAGGGALNAANSIFIGTAAGYGDTVDNVTVPGTSILIGDNTSTGTFSNSIAIGANATNSMPNQFLIAPAYNNWQIAGVDYVMPGSQGTAGTVLTNDGWGGLTWGTSLTTDSINISGDIMPIAAPVNNNIITTVDSTGDVGLGTSLALGSDGFARISYYDYTNGDLKFAQCTNADCTTKNITSVDNTGNVGGHPSLALGSDGFARITYYDQTNVALKFAQCTNADCTTKNITTVDTNSGAALSIALGSDGFARIVYFSNDDGLNFAQCTNADCTTKNITIVDNTGGNPGVYLSLALGSDGFARIAYYRQATGDLKFAQCTNADCSTKNITFVETTGDVGSFASLAIGSDGFARIAYSVVVPANFYNLKFAECTNDDCTAKNITTIDTGYIEYQPSIALGSDGYFRISYMGDTHLKFAQCLDDFCITKNLSILDSIYNVGLFSSLAIGSDTFARISYYDHSTNDLKFFRATNATGILFTGGSNIGSSSSPFNKIYASQLFAKQSLVGNFDLAENYPTKDASLTAGYIVSLDKNNPVFVQKGDNTTRTIGIVSTTPGSILGGYNDQIYKDEKKVPIALSGRVPVKVNLENGPISEGDDISLSSTSGIGKKAKEGEDTVGIALEPYNGSQDSILVFVHLQTSLSDLNLKVADLSSLDTTSATSLGSLIKQFLGDQANTIADLYVKVIHSDRLETKELCVGATCVTESQFLEMINKNVTTQITTLLSPPVASPVVETPTITTPTTTPDTTNDSAPSSSTTDSTTDTTITQ